MKEFNINDINEDNVRIRAYMSHNETMQDVYKDDMTAVEQNLNNYKCLTLEIKKDDEVFEPYDPNMQNLKVLVWKDEYNDADNSL